MTTTLQDESTRLMLKFVPEERRNEAILEATQRLSLQSNAADLGVAASLVHLQPVPEAQGFLLNHLRDRIDSGNFEEVISICGGYAELKDEVLKLAFEHIAQASTVLEAFPKWSFEPLEGMKAASNSTTEAASGDAEGVLTKATHYLSLATRLTSTSSHHEPVAPLLHSCLILACARDRALCSQAHKAILNILTHNSPEEQSEQDSLWERIRSLIGAADTFYQSIGFSIWLRWALSSESIGHTILSSPEYWQALVHGLRRGDSERRKSALQVLKASIEIALSNPSLERLIVADNHEATDPSTVRQQYSRFCTVFETIVLGRYLNQVQECEPDLDFFASTHSVVKPVWLYTLLASALDSKMQDSNRKFIGSWILRSNLRTDDGAGYVNFLREALLPWATQGYLFTSTLRRGKDSAVTCGHGDRLAKYVSSLLVSSGVLSGNVLDAILENILGKANNNFAYAMVYLFQGIGVAFEHDLPTSIDEVHVIKANKIVVWAALLPEVARDFILARLWKICHDFLRQRPESPGREALVPNALMWKQVLDKAASFEAKRSNHREGPIAALASETSRRDRNEVLAIDKCHLMIQDLERESNDKIVSDFSDRLDDIWSDLEYLEYPKSLLMALPTLVVHPKLIAAASGENQESIALKERLTPMVKGLLEQTGSRAYLLPPLMRGLRIQALSAGKASSIFDIEELIIHFAENPSSPPIDSQLEDAAAGVVASICEELSGFGYEFYYGQRESHGFAAFLDLVSRLGERDPAIPERIALRVLDRWVKQKTPPPTVSPWKTTLQLQVLLICLEQYLPRAGTEVAERILKDLQYTLSIEPLPRYRYLMEWIVARIYLRFPSLRPIIFDELRTKDHHSNPKFLASLMKIGAMVAKSTSSDEAFAFELATVFVPLAASSKVVIRHEAQWQVPMLMDHAVRKGWQSIAGSTAFKALDEFIRTLSRFDDPPLERQIDRLDPDADQNFTHLVEGAWYELDNIEGRQTNRDCFVSLYAEDSQNSAVELSPSCMPLGSPVKPRPSGQGETTAVDHSRKILQNIDNISRALGAGPGPAALQTKGNAYLESARKRHESLLVIASLVDNPYNLGGLSRVSEIFGAGALYIPNTHVISNRDFTGVSVSSHLHFPINQLPAAQLHAFLVEKKQKEGYAVVGIEQTDRSVMLGAAACALPKKCILVMGSEREGIPAVILSECDVLVEIPQLGITRSLNVQTAAGIVLCEYAKQHTL